MKDSNLNLVEGKTILLVNTGPIKKRFTVQRMKKMGLKIIALNREKNWAQPYVDHWIIADLNNYSESINQVKLFLNSNPDVRIDGVITFWEESVLLTSKIVDAFHLIGIPFNIAKKARNKYLFREFCEMNGIRAPRHMLIRKREDLKNVKEKLTYPVVIKPVYGSSSAFVIKTETEEELLEAYDYIQKNIASYPDAAEWDNLRTFVEEYIDGDEVDIDILLQNGKMKFYSISDNFNKSRGAFFVDTGQAIPSGLPIKNQNELISMTEEILEKLGIYNGCLHIEAKSTKHGPVPLEVNLRMGGDYIYSYNKTAWNVDLIEYGALIALGQYIKIERNEIPHRYIIGWDLTSPYSGILVELSISPDISKLPYVEEVHINKRIGDPLLVPPEGYDYLGWMTVTGDNLLDARDNLQNALRHINYRVVKFDESSFIGKTSRKNSFSHASINTNRLVQAAKIEKIKRVTKQDQRSLHLGIASNYFDEADEPNKENNISIGKNIEQILKNLGYQISLFDFNDLKAVFNKLKSSDVDLIFNICKPTDNYNRFVPDATAMLDMLQIPYTGSNPLTLGLCIDKIYVKKLLTYHNIPTPRWDYVYTVDEQIDDKLRYPLIVKPAYTDNSIGITNDSVVTNSKELKKQLEKVISEFGGPVLIEEYIEGDEYDVSILGNEGDNLRVLPLSRSIFDGMPDNRWHIFTQEIKSSKKSIEDFGIKLQRPAKNISKKLEAVISEISLDTYSILDCHDYGRVEIRVDKKDNPYVLELNPNPSLKENSCLPVMAKLMNISYQDLIEEIINLAVKRYADKSVGYKFSSN